MKVPQGVILPGLAICLLLVAAFGMGAGVGVGYENQQAIQMAKNFQTVIDSQAVYVPHNAPLMYGSIESDSDPFIVDVENRARGVCGLTGFAQYESYLLLSCGRYSDGKILVFLYLHDGNRWAYHDVFCMTCEAPPK